MLTPQAATLLRHNPTRVSADILATADYEQIARAETRDGVTVSTIHFLSCYETLVMGGKHDGLAVRYKTRPDAISGHVAMLALVRS